MLNRIETLAVIAEAISGQQWDTLMPGERGEYLVKANRVFDALEEAGVFAELEAKVEGFEKQFPCDGGCNPNDGPNEECSRHGRTPKELWGFIAEDIVGRDAATERAETAEARIAQAAELHTKERDGNGNPICWTCGMPFPCTTRRALGVDDGGTR